MRKFHLVYIISAVRNRCLALWRKKEFEIYTGEGAEGLSIIGKIYLRNPNVHVGKNVTIYPGVMFWGDGKIVIGDNVDIGKDTIIYSSKEGGIIIGNYSHIAGQCYIIDMDHGIEKGLRIDEQQNTVKKVQIGTDCWIGADATILKGSIIEDGAVIAAKALVKGTVASNSIVAGIPARKIKERTA